MAAQVGQACRRRARRSQSLTPPQPSQRSTPSSSCLPKASSSIHACSNEMHAGACSPSSLVGDAQQRAGFQRTKPIARFEAYERAAQQSIDDEKARELRRLKVHIHISEENRPPGAATCRGVYGTRPAPSVST
jgi:hypothetical protein